MNTLKTTLVSALTLSAVTVGFAGDALADHRDGRGWDRGRGYSDVDVFIDAGRNQALERIIAQNLVRTNPRMNIVYSPRYADITVTVDGRLSEPYRDGRNSGRHNAGLIAMDYDYRIRVRDARGRTILTDRISGQVSERLDRRGGYYHDGAYLNGEIAKDVFGVLVDVIIGEEAGYRDRGRYRLERELALEAYNEVGSYIAHIKIPKKIRRHR